MKSTLMMKTHYEGEKIASVRIYHATVGALLEYSAQMS